MGLYASALCMNIKIPPSLLFELSYKLSMFSSALKGKRKTDYTPETASVKPRKLHSGDDGIYVP